MEFYGQNDGRVNGVSNFQAFQTYASVGEAVPEFPVMQSTPTQVQNYGWSTPERMSIDEKLSHILVKLTNMETSQVNMYREFESFGASMKSMSSRVDNLDIRTDTQSKLLKLLAYKSIDLEARARRINLIFKGIPEDPDERRNSEGGPDACLYKIKFFLEGEMGYENAGDFPIQRAHRLGQRGYYVRGQYTRPIIVAFQNYSDTETIISNSFRLRNTQYSITRDYPKEIADARKVLYPHFKSARDNKKKASFKYPARLVVEGHTIEDMFPDWYDIMKLDRLSMCRELSKAPRERNVYSTSTVDDNSASRDRDRSRQNVPSHNTSHIAEYNPPNVDQANQLPPPGSSWETLVNRRPAYIQGSKRQPGVPCQPEPPMQTQSTNPVNPPPTTRDSQIPTCSSFMPDSGRSRNNELNTVHDRSYADVVNSSATTVGDRSTASSPSILQPARQYTSTSHNKHVSQRHSQNNTNINNVVNNSNSHNTGSLERSSSRANDSSNQEIHNRRQGNPRDLPRSRESGGIQ